MKSYLFWAITFTFICIIGGEEKAFNELEDLTKDLVEKSIKLSKEDAKALIKKELETAVKDISGKLQRVFEIDQVYGTSSSQIIDSISILKLLRKSKSLNDPKIQTAGKLLELKLDGGIIGFLRYPDEKKKSSMHEQYIKVLKIAMDYRRTYPKKETNEEVKGIINTVFDYAKKELQVIENK